MGKWIAGILGAVLSGVILWAVTTYLPKYLDPAPPPAAPDNSLHVECAASRYTVAPGGSSEITVTVKRGGHPVEGANVKIEVGGGSFPSSTLATRTGGVTFSDGAVRTVWKAPASAGTVFEISTRATATDGTEGTSSCGILVSA